MMIVAPDNRQEELATNNQEDVAVKRNSTGIYLHQKK